MEKKSPRKNIDWEKIEAECVRLGWPDVVYHFYSKTGESFLSGTILLMLLSDTKNTLIEEAPDIVGFEREFPVTRGKVDYLLFHADGSLTVCEVKDGKQGLQSVLAGIGQVMGYAIQIGMARSGATSIRRALLFSRTHSVEDDLIVTLACEAANIIPVPIGSEDEHRESFVEKIRTASGIGLGCYENATS